MPFCFGGLDEVYSGILNRVTFGARKGKFFIRSAASGVGKILPTINRRKNWKAKAYKAMLIRGEGKPAAEHRD